ncbi:hypothetical protein Emed_005961 [Eimeria media]
MEALLQQQQKQQQAAHAAQSSLVERTKHQEEQHRAKVTRLRWTKAYTQLRQQERILSGEIKQLLSSELHSRIKETVTEDNITLATQTELEGPLFLFNNTSNEDALVERVGSACPQDRGRHLNTETSKSPEGGDACAPQTPRSVSSSEETQRPISNKSWVLPGRSSSVTLTHPEGSLDRPLTLLRLARKVLQVVSDKFSICSNFKASSHQAVSGEMTSDAIPFSVFPELVRSHKTCEVAGLIFQWVRGLLQEKGSLLDQACAAAAAEVSAAFASLQEEGDLLQQCSPIRDRKHRKVDAQLNSLSLTDTEDAVLNGEAPQVRAAAAAASQLTLASKLYSLKAAQLQKVPSAGQPCSLRQSRAPSERELATHFSKTVGNQKTLKVSRGRGVGVQFMWEAVLKEYSERLVHLEESHTQQLGKYQDEICAQKKRLREAVAQMLAQSVSCQSSSSATSAERRLGFTPLQQHTCSIGQSPQDTNSVTGEEKGVESTRRNESQSESSSLTTHLTAGNSHCQNEQVADSVISPFESDAQRAGETMTTEDSIDIALLIVRWLAASYLVNQRGGTEETESLPQRLQLAFPFADLEDIKRVVAAQQRLSATRQKKLTCKRVWEREREAALADVLRTLEEISSSQLELAEGHRALAALKDRQGLLQKRLQLQRIKAEEQKRILTAARREEEEAQQKRELQKAGEERERREKEKALLLLFRQKKIAEAQQEQERMKQEEEAAKEPEHLKLLKAARVARRQEQHNLRVLEQQLERQERQLQEQVLRQRLMVAASKLKPSAVRSPLRLLQQTAASQSQADAAAEQRHLQQKQIHDRLSGFEVQHSYSCAQLMQDIRFRLSAALAEKELAGSKAAHELLLSMSRHTDIKH